MTARPAAERLAAHLDAPVDLMDEALRVMEAEGYIAVLPRQPTLEAVVPVLTATTDKAEAYAAAVIAEINRLTGRSFKLATEAVKQAKALIRAKVAIGQMLAMVRFMAGKWLSKSEMAEYVQPSTLMRPSNAKKYIAMMEAGPVRSAARREFKQLGED